MTYGKIKLPEARENAGDQVAIGIKSYLRLNLFYCTSLMIGTENSRHFLNQSDSKLKSIRDSITRLYRDLRSFPDEFSLALFLLF